MTTDMKIERNAKVMASDGEVGRVKHVVVDRQTKEVTQLVVEDGGEQYLVPMTSVASVNGDRVMLSGGRATVGQARFDRETYHAVDEEQVAEESTETARRGGAPLLDADDDEVEVGARQQAAPMPTGRRTERHDSDGPYHLQLREERLRVEKVQEEAGEVRLGKRVVEREETVNVPLREERVIIERRAGSGEVSDRPITDGETIEVDLMRERVNVEKEAVVAEEVSVRKDVTERQERVSETVRREELVVEGDEGMIAKTKEDAARRG